MMDLATIKFQTESFIPFSLITYILQDIYLSNELPDSWKFGSLHTAKRRIDYVRNFAKRTMAALRFDGALLSGRAC